MNTETNVDSSEHPSSVDDYLYRRLFSTRNVKEAIKQVCANGGAPGVDRVTCKEFKEKYLKNSNALQQLIQYYSSSKYKHKAIKRVYIPKDNGDKRPLGIPNVDDRVMQQMVAQVLSRHYEPIFADQSCGFRPNKSAHDALRICYGHIQDGYVYVIDMDLAKFFDTVNHRKLKQVIHKELRGVKILSIIHKFLTAKILDNGKATRSTIGTPQGGPVSPILANILLNELDQELVKRNLRFVRYADDMMIFCKSLKAANRVCQSVTKFLEQELLLKVNLEKTKIAKVNRDLKFLGHCFYISNNSRQGQAKSANDDS